MLLVITTSDREPIYENAKTYLNNWILVKTNPSLCAMLSDVRRPTSDVRCQTSDLRHLTSDLPSLPQNHHLNRLKQYLEIQPQRPVVDIGEIHLHPILEPDLVSLGHTLPHAGEPRLHGEAPPLPRLVFIHLSGDGRSGPHQAHFPPHHIDDLGEFVQAGFPYCRFREARGLQIISS